MLASSLIDLHIDGGIIFTTPLLLMLVMNNLHHHLLIIRTNPKEAVQFELTWA